MINIKLPYPEGDDTSSFDGLAQMMEGLLLSLQASTHMGIPMSEAITHTSRMMSDNVKNFQQANVTIADLLVAIALMWGRDTGRVEFVE